MLTAESGNAVDQAYGRHMPRDAFGNRPGCGLSPANGAIKRHKATVIIEAATSADTRNHNPSKSPIGPAAKANNMMPFSQFLEANTSGTM